MKKILIFFLLVLCRNVFPQVIWIPVTIDLNIPIATYTHSSGISANGGRPYDTSFVGEEKIEEHALGKLQSYSRNGDTIVASYFAMGYYFENIDVRYIFDSVNNKLKDFFFSTKGSAARVTRNFSMQLKSISFIPTSDTTFFITDSGVECINDIENVSYLYDYTSNPGPFGSNHVTSHFDSLFKNDTSSFRISFSFQSLRLPNAVDEKLSPQPTLIFVNLPNGTVKVNYSQSIHPQPLLIYDILGREIYRTEIEPGTSQFTLPTSQFASGHYFARLGNMTAHFAVY